MIEGHFVMYLVLIHHCMTEILVKECNSGKCTVLVLGTVSCDKNGCWKKVKKTMIPAVMKLDMWPENFTAHLPFVQQIDKLWCLCSSGVRLIIQPALLLTD